MVSRAAAFVLLAMYGCLLIFVLYTHKDLVSNEESSDNAKITDNNDPLQQNLGNVAGLNVNRQDDDGKKTKSSTEEDEKNGGNSRIKT